MSITKQYLKSKPECKVTFLMSAPDAEEVFVVGDFNDWTPEDKFKLKKLKNGTFKGAFNLPKDSTYQFRYVVDGNWVNDEEADRYQWNDFAAAENSVIEL